MIDCFLCEITFVKTRSVQEQDQEKEKKKDQPHCANRDHMTEASTETEVLVRFTRSESFSAGTIVRGARHFELLGNI